ncbi:hypothetical protein WICPIJ_009471 [Wickerhamomyces pijperi]|uniref:Uncharacterized protein n=1 Tax=Wickerhamomyces pijperi TaxID=599730 RepID=A0A9P8PNR0_WICPI|nr:hypothetical protein WICPIJ_009471 [Wickerhamomyces pijperi]
MNKAPELHVLDLSFFGRNAKNKMWDLIARQCIVRRWSSGAVLSDLSFCLTMWGINMATITVNGLNGFYGFNFTSVVVVSVVNIPTKLLAICLAGAAKSNSSGSVSSVLNVFFIQVPPLANPEAARLIGFMIVLLTGLRVFLTTGGALIGGLERDGGLNFLNLLEDLVDSCPVEGVLELGLVPSMLNDSKELLNLTILCVVLMNQLMPGYM